MAVRVEIEVLPDLPVARRRVEVVERKGVGHPDTISGFNTQPDNCLTDFGGAWADYIQCYLWSLYNYEQYGGQPMVWDLIHNPANGMPVFTYGFDPVRIVERLGMQTGLDTQAFSNTMPREARASRFGVRTWWLPMKPE